MMSTMNACTTETIRVGTLNLGCRMNRVELDDIARSLKQAGLKLVEAQEADYIIVNTCAVTGEAEAKTRKALRRMLDLPQHPLVIATGCVANLFTAELESLSPRLVVVADKERVAARVLEESGCYVDAVQDSGSLVVDMSPTGRLRPGVKIQDGCDNRCSFCIVWKARGAARSVDPEKIIRTVQGLVASGAQEVVLSGINLGTYNFQTQQNHYDLSELLELLIEKTDIARIRLSSIEPPDVHERLCRTMATHQDRIAPFLHICLQAGCDETLRGMARSYTCEDFRNAVHTARAYLPQIVLGTDLIVGFPGETDEQFAESLAFCEEMQFANMHVFRYSKRPGTDAAERSDQISAETIAERSRDARKLTQQMRKRVAQSLIGLEDQVLIQEPGLGITGGLFEAQVSEDLSVGTLYTMRFDGVDSRGRLKATLIDRAE